MPYYAVTGVENASPARWRRVRVAVSEGGTTTAKARRSWRGHAGLDGRNAGCDLPDAGPALLEFGTGASTRWLVTRHQLYPRTTLAKPRITIRDTAMPRTQWLRAAAFMVCTTTGFSEGVHAQDAPKPAAEAGCTTVNGVSTGAGCSQTTGSPDAGAVEKGMPVTERRRNSELGWQNSGGPSMGGRADLVAGRCRQRHIPRRC